MTEESRIKMTLFDKSIDDSILDLSVETRNLSGRTLREVLGSDPTLLAFIRHLG